MIKQTEFSEAKEGIVIPRDGDHGRRKKEKSNINILSIVTLTVALGALGFGIYNYYNGGGNTTTYNYGVDGNTASFTEGSIAEVAAKVADSVVSITTEVRTQSWSGMSSSTATAAGTGFILSESGYIMTNKHVVEDAKTVNVTLNDGTTYKNVEVVGLDPLNDSAILKVDGAKDFKPVVLGDSKTVVAGQQVVVIGNALGEYQNSVTAGIISGTGRELIASDSSGSAYEKLSDMIQTDAAINGGNSGGPIVNAAGQVIGIATAYASTSQTVGFAIPIGSVKGIINQVLETGEYARAVIGVSYVPLTPDKAEGYGLSVNYGAYLHSDNGGSSIVAGGAAEKAGLKEEDIIVAVNDVKIGKSGSLSTLVGEYKVNDTINLTVLRNGKEETIKVTLQAYKS